MPEQQKKIQEVNLDEKTAGLMFKIEDDDLKIFEVYGSEDVENHPLRRLIVGLKIFLSQELGLNYALFLGNAVLTMPQVLSEEGMTKEQLELFNQETKGNA